MKDEKCDHRMGGYTVNGKDICSGCGKEISVDEKMRTNSEIVESITSIIKTALTHEQPPPKPLFDLIKEALDQKDAEIQRLKNNLKVLNDEIEGPGGHKYLKDFLLKKIEALQSKLDRAVAFINKSHHLDGCGSRYAPYDSNAKVKLCDCGKIEVLAEIEGRGE